MSISQNYAIFYDSDSVILVDSFDNHHFDVRMGTIIDTKAIGQVTASSDEELNQSLEQLVKSISK